MKRWHLPVTALCAVFSLTVRANAAEFYVTIDGGPRVKFAGEGTGAHKNALVGIGYHYEMSSPRDLATGNATGKRQHGAVTFTKEWGAMSPMLLQACSTNEVLKTVTFEFYKPGPNGAQELYYTVTLTNATVSKIVQHTATKEPG